MAPKQNWESEPVTDSRKSVRLGIGLKSASSPADSLYARIKNMELLTELQVFASRLVASIFPFGLGAVLSYGSICLLLYFGPYQSIRDDSESAERRQRLLEKIIG